jgi:hypothetical protein
MSELILLGLMAQFPVLTALYWICFIVGGGLLLISTLMGSHADAGIDADIGMDADIGGIDADVGGVDADIGVDADVSVDADVGVDADVSVDADVGADVDVSPGHVGGDVHADHVHVEHTHPGAASLANWFSIRFVIFFMAVFGLIGVVLTHLTDTSSGLAAGWAVLGGLVVGQGVHQLIRKLQRTSGDSTPQARDYVNKLARVTIAITYPRKGEIALHVGRGERFVPAVSKREGSSFKTGEEVAVVGYSGGIAEVVSREEFEFLQNKS